MNGDAENNPTSMAPSKTKRNVLTTKQKGIIVGMMTAGATASHVAQKLGLPRQTVSGVNRCYHDRGTVATASRSGGPCKLDEADLRQLNRELASHRKDKLAEIGQLTSKTVSCRTIRRRAHDLGYL